MKLHLLLFTVPSLICSLSSAQGMGDGGSRATDGSHIVWASDSYENATQMVSQFILKSNASECLLESDYSRKHNLTLTCGDRRTVLSGMDGGGLYHLTFETKLLGELASFSYVNISVTSQGEAGRTFVFKRGQPSARRELVPVPSPVSAEVDEELTKVSSRIIQVSKDALACSIHIPTVTNTHYLKASMEGREVPHPGGYIRCSSKSGISYVSVPRVNADRASIQAVLTNKFIEAKFGIVGTGVNKLFHSTYLIPGLALLM